MRELIGVATFITLILTLIYLDANSKVTLYECQKTGENAPYFIGLKRNFDTLKNNLSSFKEEDCDKSTTTKDVWYNMKQQLKYRKY